MSQLTHVINEQQICWTSKLPNGMLFFILRQLRLLFTTKAWSDSFSYLTPLILMLPADILQVYMFLCTGIQHVKRGEIIRGYKILSKVLYSNEPCTLHCTMKTYTRLLFFRNFACHCFVSTICFICFTTDLFLD